MAGIEKHFKITTNSLVFTVTPGRRTRMLLPVLNLQRDRRISERS